MTDNSLGSRASWPFLMLLLPWLAARVYIAAGGFHLGSFTDTFSYSYRGDSFYDRGQLVSLTGNAPRVWGAPMFFALFSNDVQRARGQLVVSTLAFGLLAWAFWAYLGNRAVRVLAAGAVLVFSLLRPVTSWDFAVLSEPLSISLGVLAVAALLLWLRSGSWWSWGLLVASTFWWLFIRAELRLAVAVLVVAFVLIAIRKTSRGVRRGQATAAAAVLIVGLGWVTAITPTIDRTFQRWSFSGFEQKEEIFALRLAYRILPDPDVRRAYREMGLPKCPETMRHLGPGADRRREFLAAYRQCPRLRRWGVEHGNLATVRLVLREPTAAGRQFQTNSRWLVSNHTDQYSRARSVLPAALDDVVFPPPEGSAVLITFWGVLLLVVSLALAVGAVARHQALTLVCLGVTAVCLGLIVFADVFCATEMVRFGAQESILIKLMCIGLLCAALDTVIERVRASR